jgi:hypothetical protein
MSQFDWPITQKKKKLWRLPKLEGSIFKYRVPPLGERREAPSLPNVTSHWLHGNSIPIKIGCHYFLAWNNNNSPS